MRSTLSPLTRAVRQTVIVPVTATRASSSQAGPSTSAPPSSTKQAKRLPKTVLRDLVKLHHTASTFMHDPTQLPDAFETAFRAGSPEHLPYSSLLHAAGAGAGAGAGGRGRYGDSRSLLADEPCATFGKTKSHWSSKGALVGTEPLTEREKQVREALFGTFERGPGESVRPGLDGIEEWLYTSGTSVEQVARDWEDRHDEVALGSSAREAPRDTEDGQ